MFTAILMLTLSTAPVFPFDEAVSMQVTQANQLTWDASARPVQQWVFRCGEQVKTVIDGALTSISFGELVTEEGVYTRCGLTALDEGQVSTPYPIPNFAYRYSYWPVTKLSVELIGLLAAIHAVGFVCRRKIARTFISVMRRVTQPPLLVLEAPIEQMTIPPQTVDERRHL